MQIHNDTELQTLINSANNGKYRSKIKKQMVKEYEIVDGFPILDEFEHTGMDRMHTDASSINKIEPYRIEFRLPLKGIN